MGLPQTLRPRNVFHRKFVSGLDLPSWFNDELKSIDSNLHLVWHPHRVLWDDIINEYEGSLEDGRFTIHQEHGQENWGFVLSYGDGSPIPDRSWHIWRLCDPFGWAHIVKLEDRGEEYLNLCLKRLWRQATVRNKYGDRAYNKELRDGAQAEHERKVVDRLDLNEQIQKQNSWHLRRAMENFERGIVKPTNPQREQIISYPGQTNKTKTTRPLEDSEGGLVTE